VATFSKFWSVRHWLQFWIKFSKRNTEDGNLILLTILVGMDVIWDYKNIAFLKKGTTKPLDAISRINHLSARYAAVYTYFHNSQD